MIFNPIDKYYKSQTGAIKENEVVTFRLTCFCSYANLVIYDEEGFLSKINMQKDNGCFRCDVSLNSGLYWYYFEIDNGKFIGLNSETYLGEMTYHPTSFQLSVYSENYKTPTWLNGGIIYQIFPDRFCRFVEEKAVEDGKIYHKNWKELPVFLPNEKGEVLNNDFFGGDIKGIISKLDYLKELNVNAIYLNPIFEAYSNHRYDTGNYFKIDSLLGNESDLISLIDNAKERGIRIILDGVFNHTGSNSIYFNKDNRYNSVGAFQSKNSPYYDWYSFNEFPNKYDSWWGIKTLPAVRKDNDKFLNYICGDEGVIAHYTKLGIGGWRLDVVDELPEHFSQSVRKAIKNINSDAVVIGEVWEDASNKIAYGKRRKYFLGKELDSVMNYPLKDAILNFVKTSNAKELQNVIKTQIDHYPKIVLDNLMNILSTHDTIRLLSVVSGVDINGKDKEFLSKLKIPEYLYSDCIFRLKVAVLLQYTLYGVPSIYYGDEIGMEGFFDPLNRQTFDWNNKNYEILSFYKKLGEIRNISCFSTGEFNEVYCENGFFAFIRKDEASEILVAVNLGDREYNLDFDGELKNLLDNSTYVNNLSIKGRSFYLLINNSH